MSTAVTETKPRPSLVAHMASKYQVDPEKMLATLKATAFAGDKEVSNEQMMALLVVANQYNLNPWLREIYAFPVEAKKGGIVAIIGIDGWIRMVNERPELVSIEFNYPECSPDEITPWIECVITRKDRQVPIAVREYYAECKRNTGPWNSHPRRMLRHKALIQAARIAFGFGGVHDPDEGERIVEVDVTPARNMKPKTERPKAVEKQKATPTPATEDQLDLVREALAKSDVTDIELYDKFEVGSLAEITFDQVTEVIGWINGRSA